MNVRLNLNRVNETMLRNATNAIAVHTQQSGSHRDHELRMLHISLRRRFSLA